MSLEELSGFISLYLANSVPGHDQLSPVQSQSLILEKATPGVNSRVQEGIINPAPTPL